jgi:hypothetical protein
MATTEAAAVSCFVCDEAIVPGTSAECNWCDRAYHLNQRNDVEGKDCGSVWIDEQFLALQFACNVCLRGEPQPARAAIRPAPGMRRRYKKRA